MKLSVKLVWSWILQSSAGSQLSAPADRTPVGPRWLGAPRSQAGCRPEPAGRSRVRGSGLTNCRRPPPTRSVSEWSPCLRHAGDEENPPGSNLCIQYQQAHSILLLFINFYIASPTYCFILMYSCALTVVIKRICYVMLFEFKQF